MKIILEEKNGNDVPVSIEIENDNEREFLLEQLRPQGEWKIDGALIACNKCGRILLKASELYNFCPNCGAKMQKGGADMMQEAAP